MNKNHALALPFIVALIALLLAACAAPPGDTGPQGPPGMPGTAGTDGVVAGSRLTPLYWLGADGSRIASGKWHDGDRDEECSFRDVGIQEPGAVRCIPEFVETTGFNVYVDPDCSGEFGWQLYAGGMSFVRVLPNGRFYEAGEEVAEVYTPTPYPDGPCAPYSATEGPFYVWHEVAPQVFVSADLAP